MEKIIREYGLILICLLLITGSFAQQQKLEDSLREVIRLNKKDTGEVNALAILGMITRNVDSMAICTRQVLNLSKSLNYRKGEAHGFFLTAYAKTEKGDIGGAIQSFTEALHIYENVKDNTGIASAYLFLQGTFRNGIKDYRKSLDCAFLGEEVAGKNNVKGMIIFYGQRLAPLFLAEMGGTYLLMNKLDSALYYTRKSIDYDEQFNGSTWNFPYYLLATIQFRKGDYTSTLKNYRLAKYLAVQNLWQKDTIQINSGISTLYKELGDLDSAKYYAISVIKSWNVKSEPKNLMEAVSNLGQVYKLKGEKDSAIKYIELKQTLENSIYSENKRRDVQNFAFSEEMRKQELETAQASYKSRLQKMALAGGLLALLLIAGILLRNNRQKQRSYATLEKQKQETELQKTKSEEALEKLKSTQEQLIQSEKMASLGELTAGIAHEIQNPLNFVNNFSEVNTELIDEASQAIDAGKKDEAKELLGNLRENQEKINYHGHRADAIVKGMLQHSRSSTGQKEPTDINALAAEYIRLSYHGLRAKENTFNATVKTDFDESIKKAYIVPQEIGRVLLNLFNNAFYAVSEKQKQAGAGYEPIVSVSTIRIGDKIEIRVEDNGIGIPQYVKEKIFQPFFTTKPTGEGTGLGLSISYDIIKTHGGSLRVETKENEYTLFILDLPFNLSV